MFWDTLRGMLGAGWGFDSGGECPACKHKGCIWVTLSPRGLAWMGCRNCTWKAEECPTCDGTGVLGYDAEHEARVKRIVLKRRAIHTPPADRACTPQGCGVRCISPPRDSVPR
jgi:hypothetical protein